MHEAPWIGWTRTRLEGPQRAELMTALTPQQTAQLLEHDYVWVEQVGVLWNPPNGGLMRRTRFTHGAHFQTQHGTFYIDSEGSAREIAAHGREPRVEHATQ